MGGGIVTARDACALRDLDNVMWRQTGYTLDLGKAAQTDNCKFHCINNLEWHRSPPPSRIITGKLLEAFIPLDFGTKGKLGNT